MDSALPGNGCMAVLSFKSGHLKLSSVSSSPEKRFFDIFHQMNAAMPMIAKDPATAIPAIDLVPTPLLPSLPSVLEAEADEEVAVPELVTVWMIVVTPPFGAVDTSPEIGRLDELERGVLAGVELVVLEGGGVVVVDVGGGVDGVSDELDGVSEVEVVDFGASLSV